MDALIMGARYGGLTDDHKYLGDLTLEEQLQELHVAPPPMIQNETVLVSYSDLDQDHGDMIPEPQFAMPLYHVTADDTYGLGSDSCLEF